MRARPLALLVALAAVPALAACGSDDDSPATAAGGGTLKYQGQAKDKAADKGAPVAPAAAAEIKVDMASTQFAPAAVTAKVGQKITWKNSDPVAHTATATENAKFDSGTIEAGGTFEYVTKKAGTISYVCDFHPGMTGTIKVQ